MVNLEAARPPPGWGWGPREQAGAGSGLLWEDSSTGLREGMAKAEPWRVPGRPALALRRRAPGWSLPSGPQGHLLPDKGTGGCLWAP